MRRSVSGDTPTTNDSLSKEVTVRQVPLMLMLSPRWQSPRISPAEDMVSDVPPVSSWLLSSETAAVRQLSVQEREIRIRRMCVLPMISTIPVNMSLSLDSIFSRGCVPLGICTRVCLSRRKPAWT